MVDVADRGRWAKQRHDPIAHQGPKHEHVVALVAIPGAACREVRQTQKASTKELLFSVVGIRPLIGRSQE